MIRKLSPLVLVSVVLISSCQTQKPALEVNFEDIEDGIAFLYDTRSFTTDTIAINNGSLKYRNQIESPGIFNLWIDGINEFQRSFLLVLSSKSTKVRFDHLEPVKETQNIYEIYPNQPEFKYDPNHNEEYYKYQRDWLVFYDSIINLSATDYTKDTLLEYRKAVYLIFLAEAEGMVTENRERLVSALILEHLRQNNLLPLEKIQQQYDGLSVDVTQNPYLDKIKLEAGFQPGTSAPSFNIIDTKGRPHSLEGLMGSKILLHFWSSTCSPCIIEAPELITLQKNFESLKIINVSLDRDESRWHYGIEHAGFDGMVNTCDLKGLQSKIVQDYRIRGIPSYYLLDESGKIITKGELSKIISNLYYNRIKLH
jgi:thiol-disulfide isomerase/thioredoxin